MKRFSSGASTQRQQLLAHMREHGSITTYEARELLSIASPAPRIMELRSRGFDIYTSKESLPDSNGTIHRESARYILIREADSNDE